MLDLSLPIAVPLCMHDGGVIRVQGTRVSLDTIVYSFRDGASPEEIADSFPSVTLGKVYAIIAFYLDRRQEVDAYLKEREKEASDLQEKIEAIDSPVGLRERLLSRLERARHST